MKHKVLLLAAFFLVAAVSASAAFFGARWLAGQGTDDAAAEPSASAVTTPAPKPAASPAGTQKQIGYEEAEARNPNGPWARGLEIAVSEDGASFERAGTLADRAGVPSVTRASDGRLVAAFQWFPEDQESWDKVAVAFSEDDGDTWSAPQTIVVNGLPDGYQRPFDPTVVLTEGGDIRMFFTSSAGMPGPDGTTEIYSAVSEDGITYAFEGLAFSVEGERVYDSAALLLGGTWHLMTPLAPELGAYHATSEDGVAFGREDDVRTSGLNWTGNLVAWGDGAMRFYGTSMGSGIWWAESEDGFGWSEGRYTGLMGGDPAVVAREDGSYLMIYVE